MARCAASSSARGIRAKNLPSEARAAVSACTYSMMDAVEQKPEFLLVCIRRGRRFGLPHS